jgi:hypothetical protein
MSLPTQHLRDHLDHGQFIVDEYDLGHFKTLARPAPWRDDQITWPTR